MDTPDGRALLTGRVALLLVAFGCAIAAALEADGGSPALIALAVALAVVACVRPLAIRLGRALKPARSSGR